MFSPPFTRLKGRKMVGSMAATVRPAEAMFM